MAAVDITDEGVRLAARRICIVGAGAAGLAATRVFAEQNASSDPPPFDITVLERNRVIGGLWNYTDTAPCRYNVPQSTPSDIPAATDRRCPQTNSFPTPMYEHLHTNLPKDVMQFPGTPFPSDADEFPTHTQVREYLDAYARAHVFPHKFNLQLDTEVTRIEYHPRPQAHWTCAVRNVATNTTSVLEFDAVLVCTGRVNYPLIPEIPGLRALAQTPRDCTLMHAKEYRRAQTFAGQTVLVVGAASSGTDIARQLSFVAKRVHIASADASPEAAAARDPRMTPVVGAACNPQNPLVTHLRVTRFAPDRVWFADGSHIPLPDAIVFATGYMCAFPFIDEVASLDGTHSVRFTADSQGVYDLFELLVYAFNPLLAVLGVPDKVVPFPLYEYQAAYLAHVYQGHITLPPVAEMAEQARAAVAGPDAFTMKYQQAAYMDRLIDRVGAHQSRLGHVPDHWTERWKQTVQLRKQHLGY
ncbi:monooxygenase [Coemansia sp. RSA 2708]|nr:monooxygenase [Coemansia sp. RSA 2708]